MMLAVAQKQTTFYNEFLMARSQINPKDYGIDLDKQTFTDQMADDFGQFTRGMLTVDEMMLRPRVAMSFCDHVRQKNGWYDVPDDILLRTVLNRRKRPT